MKNKYLNSFVVGGLLSVAMLTSCNNEDDFLNAPKKIDINTAIEITPMDGALKLEWKPEASDSNFVFLNVQFVDQDNKIRNYNVSRYSSSVADTVSRPEPLPEKAVLIIDKLINKEYALNFNAYNNLNKKISLGTKVATPNDYLTLAPDTVTGVKIEGIRKGMILTWSDPVKASYTTFEKVRFTIVNVATQVKRIEEYTYNVRRDSLEMLPGIYDIEIASISKSGVLNINKKEYKGIEVVEFSTVELYSVEARAAWKATTSSEQPNAAPAEGPIINVLDGQSSSWWHSAYGVNGPFTIEFDLSKVETISELLFLQRPGARERGIDNFKVYMKEKASDEYTLVMTDRLLNDDNRQDMKLDKGVKAQFVKIQVLDGHNGRMSNICLSEFGLKVAQF